MSNTDIKIQEKFLKSILECKPLGTLHKTISTNLTLLIHETPGTPPREQKLRGIFPFMTINDIKLAIYAAMDMADDALPDFTFLGRPGFLKTQMLPVDYSWLNTLNPEESFVLSIPDELVGEKKPHDVRFVETSGERRIVGIHRRERMTLETMFPNKTPVLHVYFYKSLEAYFPGQKPIGERDWNGRLYPYFPSLSIQSTAPTAQYMEKVKRQLRGFAHRRQLFVKLEEILQSNAPLVPVIMSAVRYLRMSYAKPETIPGIEAMFYEIPVNNLRPYMRLIPAEGTAISKVHMIGDMPNLEDPRLLLQWYQERSATPERDFAIAKILLRRASKNITPLYCTMRLLDDGTADITIEPPKGVRKLDPRSELNTLPEIIQANLQGFPYLKTTPTLTNGMFVFGIHMKDTDAGSFTADILREKVEGLSAIFQEIPPMSGEKPLLMLRYKLVNNFMREDRIHTFLSQVLHRKMIRGDSVYSDLVDRVANEFQMDVADAKKRVADKLKQSGDVILVSEETKEYALNANPGTDIAIFQQHPFYSIHLYRVDSIESLERIITFVAMLFSIGDADLPKGVDTEEVTDTEEEEGEEEEEEEDEDEDEDEDEEEDEDEDQEEEEEGTEEAAPAQAENQVYVAPDDVPTYYDDFFFGSSALEEEGREEAAEDAEEAAIEGEPIVTEPAVTEPAVTKPAVTEPAIVAEPVVVVEEPSKKKFSFKKGATAAPPASAVVEAAPVATEPQQKSFDTYFSSKLKDADRRLFDFTKTHPSLTKYVTRCASNLMRQPAVLSEDKFEHMRREYKDLLESGKMVLYVFPLDKDKAKEPYTHKPDVEYYSVMRYGTSEQNQNYYLCCRFFCTRDEILVREVELRGDRLRRAVKQADGTFRTTKKPNTCPFCEGEVIVNRSYPGINQTIIERIPKAGTETSRHLYINFLRTTNHPEGYELPCCFLEDQPIRVGDKGFPDAAPAVSQVARKHADALEAVDEGDKGVQETHETDLLLYEEVLFKAKFAYIVGVEKLPLDGPIRKTHKVRDQETAVAKAAKITFPQIGLPPVQLNAYFSQDPIDLVSRTFNPQKLKPDAQGFLRVGVENRSPYINDSFLAAVAPFFGKSSSDTMKALIADIVQPRLFLSLNYGNLALEMYKSSSKRPEMNEALKRWAKDMLQIKRVTTNNEELVIRAYMSYERFQMWLESPDTKKEYRQFAHLFLQPGIFKTGVRRTIEGGEIVTEHSRAGVVFIIIDVLKSGEIRVRCPPYPVSKEMFVASEIGFLFHHYSGIWEPLFYVDNRAPGDRDLTTFNLLFSAKSTSLPKIVQDRLDEFTNQCQTTSGKGVFTSIAGVLSTKLVGINSLTNQLKDVPGISYHGNIRDSYNHLVGVVYKLADNKLVAVPVVDDGYCIPYSNGVLILDWDDFDPAPALDVINFYNAHIIPKYPAQYSIMRAIKSRGSAQIVAVQLANMVYVPVGHGSLEGIQFPDPQSPVEIQEMEWTINRKIVRETANIVPGEENRLRLKEFTEVYEHLRIRFSNWLHSVEDGGEFRDVIEDIIFRRDIPLFEKRKRMELILMPIMEEWISESDEDKPRQASLLRVDCFLRPHGECGGVCTWKEDANKCLIHAPKSSPVEGTTASGGEVLMARLIDELLRYAGKRNQIFEQRVSQLAQIDAPIRDKDQFIIPEKSATWTELMRSDWAKDISEKPIFLEEMSQAAPVATEAAPVATEAAPVATEATDAVAADAVAAIAQPEELKVILGEGGERLHLYPSPTGNFTPFLALIGVSTADIGIGEDALKLDATTISAIVRRTGKPVIQINITPDIEAAEKVIAVQGQRDKGLGYPVLIIHEGYPPCILVTNPEEPALLERKDLTKNLEEILKSAKKVFIK